MFRSLEEYKLKTCDFSVDLFWKSFGLCVFFCFVPSDTLPVSRWDLLKNKTGFVIFKSGMFR